MTTQEIIFSANQSKLALSLASTEVKNQALLFMAESLMNHQKQILDANMKDVANAKGHISEAMIDRLSLNEERIHAMAKGIQEVVKLDDPAGKVLQTIHRENGLEIQKVSVPMGVIAIIYESRPNVTSDAASLALKAGSACILRCGHDAWNTCNEIVNALQEGIVKAGLPKEAVQLVQDTSHESANVLMKHMV